MRQIVLEVNHFISLYQKFGFIAILWQFPDGSGDRRKKAVASRQEALLRRSLGAKGVGKEVISNQ